MDEPDNDISLTSNPTELRMSELASETMAARFLGISLPCLKQWRHAVPPRGPIFLVIGHDTLYPIAALKTWQATTPVRRTRKGFLRYEFPPLPPRAPQLDLFDAYTAACRDTEPDQSGTPPITAETR